MTQTSYVSNHLHTITTPAGQFVVEQRNVGFASNDGKWVVSLLPELYWSHIGTLRKRREGRFLGAFTGRATANAAIATTGLPPAIDVMVL